MIIVQSSIRNNPSSKIDQLIAKFPIMNNCIYCGYPNYRHLIYPDENGCVYIQDKDWTRMNNFNADKSVLIDKENDNDNT